MGNEHSSAAWVTCESGNPDGLKFWGFDVKSWCSKCKRSAFEHFFEYLSIKFHIELSGLFTWIPNFSGFLENLGIWTKKPKLQGIFNGADDGDSDDSWREKYGVYAGITWVKKGFRWRLPRFSDRDSDLRWGFFPLLRCTQPLLSKHPKRTNCTVLQIPRQ